jgi:hypothetical protein
VDSEQPYIRIERGRRDTAAIRLVLSKESSVQVVITRTTENAAAFNYFCDKLKDGMNL